MDTLIRWYHAALQRLAARMADDGRRDDELALRDARALRDIGLEMRASERWLA